MENVGEREKVEKVIDVVVIKKEFVWSVVHTLFFRSETPAQTI